MVWYPYFQQKNKNNTKSNYSRACQSIQIYQNENNVHDRSPKVFNSQSYWILLLKIFVCAVTHWKWSCCWKIYAVHHQYWVLSFSINTRKTVNTRGKGWKYIADYYSLYKVVLHIGLPSYCLLPIQFPETKWQNNFRLTYMTVLGFSHFSFWRL